VLKVLPATLDADRLREELLTCQSAAIIKVGRHFGKVKQVLSALDLITRATAVTKATQDDRGDPAC
jgi:precorrin-2/cobalt-factor-2 C20-methyltransferase